MNPEQNRQLEIDILKTLSDFTPRNQNGIISAVGKSAADSSDRVAVHRAVQRIAKYLDRKPPALVKLGERWVQETGKIWVLKKDMKTLQELVLSYPELLSSLQENDVILTMLVEKHVNEVCTDEWLSDEQESAFKTRLRISASFFRLWLLKEPGELRSVVNTLFSITERGQMLEQHNRDIMRSITSKKQLKRMQDLGFARYQPSFSDLIDVVFRTCVGADILYGRECKEGIEFIKRLKPVISLER